MVCLMTRFCVVSVVTIILLLSLTACVSKEATSTSSSNAAPVATTFVQSSVTIVPTQLPITPPKAGFSQDWKSRWLRGIPCQPPCWEGITPGTTTPDDAVKILQQNSLISAAEASIADSSLDLNYVVWDWKGLTPKPSGRVGSGGDALYHLKASNPTIYNIRPSYSISFNLDEVIQSYGEPTHILALATPNPDLSVTYDLWFVYLPYGFKLSTYMISKDGSKTPVLSSTMLLSKLEFFAPTTQGFADAYGSQNFPRDNFLIPWQGFKDYSFYCRDVYGSGIEDCSNYQKRKP